MTVRSRPVVLVDDNPDFRETAAWWLESLGYAVTTYEEAAACLAALDDDPGAIGEACLLLDVRMPQMSGLQLLDALRARGVDRPVIFMTGHGDVPLAVEAMRRGALTFLEKPFPEAALEEALHAAFARAPATTAVPAVAAPDPATRRDFQAGVERLTVREREVMELVVAGHANKVIAYKLGISHKTVELHRSRVMAKMKAGSITHLVRMAMSAPQEAVR